MRQLLGVWVTGSLGSGTVALIFVLTRIGDVVLRPMVDLGAWGVLMLLLVIAMAAALMVLAERADSGLVEHTPGRVVWTLVVLLGGLAGWGYAATVVLVPHWAPWLLAVLAYAGGGLPFTLVAASLSRPARHAALALGASVVLLGIGALLALRPGDGLFAIVRLYSFALTTLFAQPVVPL
jgi:hypothetical protein